MGHPLPAPLRSLPAPQPRRPSPANLPPPPLFNTNFMASIVMRSNLPRVRFFQKCRVVPTGKGIDESVDLAYEIFSRVFRKVPDGL